MESYAVPFRLFAATAGWFVRAREIRVLHVVTTGELREGVLDVIAAQEYHADNVSPFVRLDEAHQRSDGGWAARGEGLQAQHTSRSAALAKEGLVLPPLGRTSMLSARTGIASFAEDLFRVLHAHCAPLQGLVVVLAPTHVEDAVVFEAELESLLANPRLDDVRWVLVDVGRTTIPTMLTRLGTQALHTEVRVDEHAAQADLARKIEGATRAPADAPGPAQVGAAWPDARPPRPPAPSPAKMAAALQGLGLPASLGDPRLPHLRPLILLAAAAMRRSAPLEAVRHQSDAVVLAKEIGLEREAAVMELMLATYVVHAGDRPRAARIYAAAADHAQEKGWFDLATQALMAMAALRLLDRERDQAAALYAQAGPIALRGGHQALAIEAFRMAGQLRAESRDEAQAVHLWTRAMEIAGVLKLPEAGQTSAPMAGRALAAVMRRRGLPAQADSLEAQATRMEAASSGDGSGAAETSA